MSCLHAHGISDLPMGNGPGLQHSIGDAVIHTSAGVATSAQAMAWCMGGSLFVCVCSHALGMFSDPPSVCGDSVLKCFIDCVCFSDPILMIVVCAYNPCA